MLTLHFHFLHFQKPYLTHLKTNSKFFCDIKYIKKGATKSFQCSFQRLLTNAKKIIKLSHPCIITILKLQYILL